MHHKSLLLFLFALCLCVTAYMFFRVPYSVVFKSGLGFEEYTYGNFTTNYSETANFTTSHPETTETAHHESVSKSTTTTDENTDLPPLAAVTCRKNSTFRIPNIIHHVWFGSRPLQFFHYISLRSAALMHMPDEVRFYYDQETPKGPYWDRYKMEVPCLKTIRIEAPTSVFGRKVNVVEHKADVARLQIMLENGGIYLDTDTVVLRKLDELMNYPCVLGRETNQVFGNAVILAEPNAPFLLRWYDSYKTFDDRQWGEHSVKMPYRIHMEHPELLMHEEVGTFYKRTWADGAQWWETKNYDISSSYCAHLYARLYSKSTLMMTERDILAFNATYGSLARIGLYGKPDLITKK